MVAGIYERIQQRELRSNEDHVTYVSRVEQSILGLKTVSEFIVCAPPFSLISESCLYLFVLSPFLLCHVLFLCILSSPSFEPFLRRSSPCPTDVWCAAAVCLRCLTQTRPTNRSSPSSRERSSSSMTCCWWATYFQWLTTILSIRSLMKLHFIVSSYKIGSLYSPLCCFLCLHSRF